MDDLKCCIFDLDGVICDTAKYHFLAWKAMAEELHIPFTEQDNERLKGINRMACLDIILSLGDPKTFTDEEKIDLATRKNQLYLEYVSALTEDALNVGVKDLLLDLKDKKIKICLGSASKNALPILQKLNIIHLFDYVVDGTMVSKAKPDPEVFMQSAEYLKLDPRSCIVFEDAFSGIEAAKHANMKSVGVGNKDVLWNADMVISSFANVTVNALYSQLFYLMD